MLTLNYDQKFDILYLTFADNSNSYGEEDDHGNLTHRDRVSHEVTSVTVFDFMVKASNGQLGRVACPKFAQSLVIYTEH